MSLLTPNASVARKCCSCRRPMSFQAETSSLLTPSASVRGSVVPAENLRAQMGTSSLSPWVCGARESCSNNVSPADGHEAWHWHPQGRVRPCRAVRRHDHFTVDFKRFRYADVLFQQSFWLIDAHLTEEAGQRREAGGTVSYQLMVSSFSGTHPCVVQAPFWSHICVLVLSMASSVVGSWWTSDFFPFDPQVVAVAVLTLILEQTLAGRPGR